eukprot:364965-Chlamydomonas_euryale.AAC.29
MQAASSTSRVPARRGLRLGAPSGATPAAGTSRAMLRQLGNAVAAVTARAASRRCAVAPSSASSGRVSLGAGLPTCGVGLRHLRPVHYAGTLSGRTAAAAVEGGCPSAARTMDIYIRPTATRLGAARAQSRAGCTWGGGGARLQWAREDGCGWRCGWGQPLLWLAADTG